MAPFGFLLQGYGFLASMPVAGAAALTVAAAGALGFFGAPLIAWSCVAAVWLYGAGVSPMAFGTFVAVAAVFNIRPLRALLVSRPILALARAAKLAPQISETERAALDAGSVWVESEFFSGRPEFERMMREPYPTLSPDERAYVDGPVEELCRKVNDWKIHQNKDIPRDIWDMMRKMGIFGMIIPKKYGGLGFSPLGHSQVIMKLASRSVPTTVTAMVPNSLGPAELLLHYGTEEQKNHYLPRLASGEDIPCFALTEQRAGSDAGSLESNGELFKRKDGSLWIRLNWNKRWITLGGIADVIGLAFELRDPDRLIGKDYIVGITCALIPRNTQGVVQGMRHDPLGVPFYNCPIQGQNVEVPAEAIIGGIRNAGKGWGMLMDCLGAGRGVSLPALGTGGCKLIARITSAHTTVRRQFSLPLCKLEGIEEPLARIAGNAYALDAMRTYIAGALGAGVKPSVVSAIAKYAATEMMRKVCNDGMDIMAGSGISRGPRNVIAHLYQSVPIGITVEGANILTRTMIIFGQGLFRAHPWAYRELQAIERNDAREFDRAIFGHLGHVVRGVFRAVILTATRGRLAAPGMGSRLRPYAQRMSWASACFAVLADMAAVMLGGNLKKLEKLTGRFADVLTAQYMAAAVMRRYRADGSPKEDWPIVELCLRQALADMQVAFEGILGNFRVPVVGWLMRVGLRPLCRWNALTDGVTDRVTHKAAVALLEPKASRDRVTEGIYMPKPGPAPVELADMEPLARLEHAYRLCKRAEEVEARIMRAVRKRELPKKRIFKLIEPALEKGIISADEAHLLQETATARWEACQVDYFSEAGYHGVEDSDTKQFREGYVGPAGAPQNYVAPKKAA